MLSKGNSKLAKSDIWTFSLQAVETCPGALHCIKDCFANNRGNFSFKKVKAKREVNYNLSKSVNFVKMINNEVNNPKIKIVRIHDSGDFYNREYLHKWLKICEDNPDVTFYAYTKSTNLFKLDKTRWIVNLPRNLTITFSYGGKYDYLIDRSKDKHSIIFENSVELKKAGYSDNSDTDNLAYNKQVKRIGLIRRPATKGGMFDLVKRQVLKEGYMNQLSDNVHLLKKILGNSFFSVVFVKKTGELRKMQCRLGVKKHLKGGELKYNPDDHSYMIVFDTVKQAYRTINLNTIQYIAFKGIQFNFKDVSSMTWNSLYVKYSLKDL